MEKSYKYRFTVFTPCYNSEKFIHRVFESLQAQTFRDFEWLLVNDASTDNTMAVLEQYRQTADFPVRIINNPTNKMLYYNYNLAFDEAEGELLIAVGHDDQIYPHTLERFHQIWETHGNEKIAGIWACCEDQNGRPIGSKFPADLMVSNYFALFEKHLSGAQERFGCMRTDVLKKYKFDLDKGRVGEGFLWGDIGKDYDTIFINDILRVYYIESNNAGALTKRTRTKVALETFLYYREFINEYAGLVPNAALLKLRFHFALAFYRVLANMSLAEELAKVNNLPSKLLLLLFTPAALVLSKVKK